MRILFYLILFSALSTGVLNAQNKTVKAYLNDRQFLAPGEGNYIEIQLNVVGYTLEYITEENKTYGELEITHIFLKDEEVVSYNKYILESPEVIDSLVEDFYDIRRFLLDPGTYSYELYIRDLHSENEAISVNRTVRIEDYTKGISISEICPAETIRKADPDQPTIFTKTGYDVIPMLTNYYPTELEWLPYYFEVYNTETGYDDSVYVVEQKIVGQNNKVELEKYNRYFRFRASEMQPVAKVIDISLLPTGTYNIEVNVLNRDKQVIASSRFMFDRNNTEEVNNLAYESVTLDPAFEESIPMDSTGYYVASLIPISRAGEVKNIIQLLKKKDNQLNKRYLQAFWKATSPESPFESWMQYKVQVQQVQRLYATNYQVGFETDRGRVYLQYGQPNQISSVPSSPSEYPYEIWQYDKINQFSNKRFVFYNPMNLNNDYRLIHSDMIGEIQNYRWKYMLNKRNTPDKDLDDPFGSGYRDHFGGNSSLYFNSY